MQQRRVKNHQRTQALERVWVQRQKRPSQQRTLLCSLNIWNTRKTSRLHTSNRLHNIKYSLYLHRRDYSYLEYRDLQKRVIRQIKKIFWPRDKILFFIKLKRKTGFVKFSVKTFMWILLRARREQMIVHIHSCVPISHGYCRLKKYARRKKRLQKIRAAQFRHAH